MPSRRMTDSSELKALWDIPLDSLYPIVLEFYKKEKDRIVLDYGQKIKLLAFYKQEKLGPYSPEKDGETGYFDVVGADRRKSLVNALMFRKAWKALNDLSRDETRRGLISILDAATPKLRSFVSEQWKLENTDKKRGTGSEACPSKDQIDSPAAEVAASKSTAKNETISVTKKPVEIRTVLAPAALWCSPRVAKQFISQVGESPENQIVISSGESVTVQVSTSTEATAIFWEFVTAEGSISFGLSYQRKKQHSNEICPMEQLLPVVNRDCSEDLVLGSHRYQTQGTYFLHFENTPSAEQPFAKTVYYKVFYQKAT